MYCLEANTLPGMTPTSLIPQEAKVLGIDYPELCEKLIEVSLKNISRRISTMSVSAVIYRIVIDEKNCYNRKEDIKNIMKNENIARVCGVIMAVKHRLINYRKK